MSTTDKQNKKTKSKVKSWYSNRYQIVVVQRNILLLFTLVSMFSVAVAVIFVKNIMSSKSLEPYVIEVEEKTGIATVVDQMSAQSFTGNQMIVKYFINQFVHMASGYNSRSYDEDVDKVRLLSSAPVFSEFRSRINARDLGKDTNIAVRIKSMQFLNSNSVQIRILTQTTQSDLPPKTRDQIITMNFLFAPEMNLSMEERLINPLGFQVTAYMIAEEVFAY
jgi:type IV secretion system protein VirB8